MPPTRSTLSPLAPLRSPFDRLRTVLVLDFHRLRGECLARMVSDHCPDLLIHIAALGEAARASLSAYAPDLIIVNPHRRALLEQDLGGSVNVPIIVIGQLGGRLGADHAMAFPPEGDVDLLIAAVRLALAGGHFVPPERFKLQAHH